jgi:hypothetical protein
MMGWGRGVQSAIREYSAIPEIVNPTINPPINNQRIIDADSPPDS